MKNRNVERIKETVTVRQVMEYYGIQFNRRGFAICPFHTEKTASLSIKNDHYKCFGCGAYGGSIDFVMNYFGLSFPQAVVKIMHDFGIPLEGQRVTLKSRMLAADNHKIEEAEKRFRKEIKDNYNWLCDVHIALMKRYVRTGDEHIAQLIERLDDILDDFSGEEARNWEMRLFHQR